MLKDFKTLMDSVASADFLTYEVETDSKFLYAVLFAFYIGYLGLVVTKSFTIDLLKLKVDHICRLQTLTHCSLFSKALQPLYTFKYIFKTMMGTEPQKS